MQSAKKNRIFLVALIANLGSFSFGICVGWSSVVVPKLTYLPESSLLGFGITKEQEGWITSCFSIGAIITSLIAGPIADKFGRKKTLLCSATSFVFSFFILLLPSKLSVIYLGRLFQGIGAGLTATTLPVYIGEIATDDARGGLGCLTALFMVGGTIFSYSIGPYTDYITFQGCCLVIPILFDLTFSFMPESPYFYAAKQRTSDGIKSLQFLRGQSETEVEEEMIKIQTEVDNAMSSKDTFLDIVLIKGHRKAFLICCGLLSLQQLCGVTAVAFFSLSIYSGSTITIYLALMQLSANMLTTTFIKRTGRRIILMISAIGMCCSLVAIGVYFYIMAFSYTTSIEWLPLTALLLFNFLYAFGFGPLPWVLLGEMLSANTKPIGTAIACACYFLSGYVATRWFPELYSLGLYYVFWMFGTLSWLATMFVFYVVIETKGMSLKSIQEKLHS